jgi:hypothetical protein
MNPHTNIVDAEFGALALFSPSPPFLIHVEEGDTAAPMDVLMFGFPSRLQRMSLPTTDFGYLKSIRLLLDWDDPVVRQLEKSSEIDLTSPVMQFMRATSNSTVQGIIAKIGGRFAVDNTTAPPQRPSISHLAARISSERATAEIDSENLIMADGAAADAVKLVERAGLGGTPRVMFSDDGILTLQWQRGEYGVALIFAGDGAASIAFKNPGQLYAENGLEVSVSKDLPAQFNVALAALMT